MCGAARTPPRQAAFHRSARHRGLRRRLHDGNRLRVVATIGSAPTGAMPRRGHWKSSARPAGGAIASPFTSARVTDLGAAGAPGLREPISSSAVVTDAVSGTTGPASGRAAGRWAWPCAGVCAAARARQRHRLHARAHLAAHFAIDVMGKLAGAGLGEMHAVADAKPADLALEIGALDDEAAGVIDEPVPDVDVCDAGLFGARAIQVVEITAYRPSTSDRGSTAARPRTPARRRSSVRRSWRRCAWCRCSAHSSVRNS